MKCSIQGNTFTIVNIYAPNQGQLSFLLKTLDVPTSFAQGLIVLCGDFNLTLQPLIDTSTECSNVVLSKLNKIRKLLHFMQLCDSWRLLHTQDRDYSFYSHPHDMYSCIDYILIQHPMLNFLVDSSIGHILHSDHAPIHCDLRLPHVADKPFNWKLNETLLSDALCLSDLQKNCEEFHGGPLL